MAATKEIRVDAAVAAVLSELDGLFTFKEQHKTGQKALLGGQHCLALLQTGFGNMVS